MYKRPLILTSCSGPSLCVAGVVPHLVGTAWAQRVLLVLALPQLQLLDLRLPEAEPEHGAVLVLVVIIPNMGIWSTYCSAGGDQAGGPCLAGRIVHKVMILGPR